MILAGRPVASTSRGRLVAGIGNVFLSDDGFGSEVARSLRSHALPDDVRVVDYGIRGTHLAYDLLDGWEALILVDAVPARGHPGRLHLLAVGSDDLAVGAIDPHSMDPATVLAGLASLGGTLPPTVVVGCEPGSLEDGIGLTPAVAAAVPAAVDAVERLLFDYPFPDHGEGKGVSAMGAPVREGGS